MAARSGLGGGHLASSRQMRLLLGPQGRRRRRTGRGRHTERALKRAAEVEAAGIVDEVVRWWDGATLGANRHRGTEAGDGGRHGSDLKRERTLLVESGCKF